MKIALTKRSNGLAYGARTNHFDFHARRGTGGGWVVRVRRLVTVGNLTTLERDAEDRAVFQVTTLRELRGVLAHFDTAYGDDVYAAWRRAYTAYALATR